MDRPALAPWCRGAEGERSGRHCGLDREQRSGWAEPRTGRPPRPESTPPALSHTRRDLRAEMLTRVYAAENFFCCNLKTSTNSNFRETQTFAVTLEVPIKRLFSVLPLPAVTAGASPRERHRELLGYGKDTRTGVCTLIKYYWIINGSYLGMSAAAGTGIG